VRATGLVHYPPSGTLQLFTYSALNPVFSLGNQYYLNTNGNCPLCAVIPSRLSKKRKKEAGTIDANVKTIVLRLKKDLSFLFCISKLRLCEESVSVLCYLCFQNFLYVKQGAYNFVSFFSCSTKNY